MTVLALILVTLLFAGRNAVLGRDTYGLGSAALLGAWCGLARRTARSSTRCTGGTSGCSPALIWAAHGRVEALAALRRDAAARQLVADRGRRGVHSEPIRAREPITTTPSVWTSSRSSVSRSSVRSSSVDAAEP